MKNKDNAMYVISILRVRDYSGNKCEPYWEYASYDTHAGSLSTGYPCFDSLTYANHYSSVEDAEDQFPKWWEDFVYGHSTRYKQDYDIKSLGIRKVIFNTKKKLTVV